MYPISIPKHLKITYLQESCLNRNLNRKLKILKIHRSI